MNTLRLSEQQSILNGEPSEILFLKESHILNWDKHKAYLKQEVYFKELLLDNSYNKNYMKILEDYKNVLSSFVNISQSFENFNDKI